MKKIIFLMLFAFAAGTVTAMLGCSDVKAHEQPSIAQYAIQSDTAQNPTSNDIIVKKAHAALDKIEKNAKQKEQPEPKKAAQKVPKLKQPTMQAAHFERASQVENLLVSRPK